VVRLCNHCCHENAKMRCLYICATHDAHSNIHVKCGIILSDFKQYQALQNKNLYIENRDDTGGGTERRRNGQTCGQKPRWEKTSRTYWAPIKSMTTGLKMAQTNGLNMYMIFLDTFAWLQRACTTHTVFVHHTSFCVFAHPSVRQSEWTE
jgi:hypothetical protein